MLARIWNDAGVYGLGEASPMVHGNASLEIMATIPWASSAAKA
jgi:hypothetical protein